jgi:hypothetical protein
MSAKHSQPEPTRGPTPAERDERLKIDADFEEALEALLKVDPDSKPPENSDD